MNEISFSACSSKRKPLDNECRIGNIVCGGVIVLLPFVSQSFQLCFILLGVFSVGYGIVGWNIVKTQEKIQIGAGCIVIKTLYSREVRVPVKNVKYISLNVSDIGFGFHDFYTSFDIRWLSEGDYSKLKKEIYGLSQYYQFGLCIKQ